LGNQDFSGWHELSLWIVGNKGKTPIRGFPLWILWTKASIENEKTFGGKKFFDPAIQSYPQLSTWEQEMSRRIDNSENSDQIRERVTMDRPVVHIVDDDPLICKVLEAIVEAGGWRAGIHGSAERFLAAYRDDEPGCVLLDMRMPGMNGLDCLRELKKRESAHPVVMVTAHGDVELAVQAMKDGALDFLEKPVTAARVLEVVERAIKLSMAQQGLRENREKTERLLAALTPRERQVLHRITRGEINKAVAKHLGISEKTVEVHRARVMSKLNAKSLADLIRIVRGEGTADPEPDPTDADAPPANVLPLRASSVPGKKS
jgi:FixJ family two-component response regulator